MKNSQPEANTRTAWNAIVLRYADTVSNDFIDLGGAAWLTAEGQRKWDRIPVSADEGSPFLADLYGGDDLLDTKLITADTVEGLLGEPVSQLVAEGRERKARAWQEVMSQRAERGQSQAQNQWGGVC